MSYLITGGSGYLGSHLIDLLLKSEIKVVVFDRKPPLDDLLNNSLVTYIQGNICDEGSLSRIPKKIKIKGAFHLAALKSVANSFKVPGEYKENNIVGTEKFMKYCQTREIQNIVFTSSAAVYSFGTGTDVIGNESECKPSSPYGLSKLISEKFLMEQARSGSFSIASMRCFNLAGSSKPQYFDHNGENVIPIILRALISNNSFTLFGDDLDTSDGTPIRDYVHVSDAANAHLLAMRYLEKADHGTAETFNVSSGVGTSVKELITALESLSKLKLSVKILPIRPGEPTSVIGDNSNTKRLLNWQTNNTISNIVSESWEAALLCQR